jgi:hypothetical protein
MHPILLKHLPLGKQGVDVLEILVHSVQTVTSASVGHFAAQHNFNSVLVTFKVLGEVIDSSY